MMRLHSMLTAAGCTVGGLLYRQAGRLAGRVGQAARYSKHLASQKPFLRFLLSYNNRNVRELRKSR